MTIWNMEITAAESPQTVHIPLEGKYYAIKNTGESDILVSSSVADPTEGADDVMKIPSGSAAIIPVKDEDLYVSAEEDGAYSISIQDDKVIPWSGGTGSGGSGGDNTHYKGTTTTALENGSTTNPIVIDGESYTAVFGDVVVYGYTEFVFDGTAWSEFGRPFDTTPTQGSTNAVTSDGVYWRTPFKRSNDGNSAILGYGSFVNRAGIENSIVAANASQITSKNCAAIGGTSLLANTPNSLVCGIANKPRTGDLFNIGNGTDYNHRSNIVEVNRTEMNVNGDIKINNVAIPTPYTTMPTITADMLGKIAMYVGTTGGGFTQGCFYVGSTDGAAEPTYSWVKIGSGRTETILWENTGTANPETITLSEAIANFDEIRILSRYTYDSVNIHPADYIHSANDIANGFAVNIYWTSADYYQYTFTSSTELARDRGVGYIYAYKIIGIKYGSGGGSGQYSGTYTPEGAVAVTPTTGKVTGVSANGTLPAVTYDTANEELTFTAGTLPTLDTDKSFVTGATATFTGTQATITVQ